GAAAAAARRRRGARAAQRPHRRGPPRDRWHRACGPAPRLPDAGTQPRGEHAVFQVSGTRDHPYRRGYEGAHRADARAGAERRVIGTAALPQCAARVPRTTDGAFLLSPDTRLRAKLSERAGPAITPWNVHAEKAATLIPEAGRGTLEYSLCPNGVCRRIRF